MKARCHNPKDTAYPQYGARGIAVCERWRHSFENFYEDMGHAWSKGMTVDRKDNDLGYTPTNCRWVTKSEQGKNRRCCIYVDSPWGNLSSVEVAKRLGMSHTGFLYRYKRGWRGAQLFAPPTEKGARVTRLTREYLDSIGKPRPKGKTGPRLPRAPA